FTERGNASKTPLRIELGRQIVMIASALTVPGERPHPVLHEVRVQVAPDQRRDLGSPVHVAAGHRGSASPRVLVNGRLHVVARLGHVGATARATMGSFEGGPAEVRAGSSGRKGVDLLPVVLTGVGDEQIARRRVETETPRIA